MSLNYQKPEVLALSALRSRGKLKGLNNSEMNAVEISLLSTVIDIVDGVLEGERIDLRGLRNDLDHIIRNTPHSCQTQEHCCALHAAHKAAAEAAQQHVQSIIDKIGKGD